MPFRWSEHSFLHLSAIFLACMIFNVTILFTSGALGHRLGLFTNSSGGFSEKFYLEKYKLDVTPADWTFYQAAVIYFWQSLWLTYGVFSVFRRNAYGYFYTTYPVLPPIVYVVFSFALACNISWLLIWDRQYMEVALVFVNLMSCNLYVCIITSIRRLNDYGPIMMAHGLKNDVWICRIVVHNGLAMFAVWGTVAAMFNFAIVLSYGTGARKDVASTVSLTIFIIEIVIWWIFDNFVYEKYLRYLFTPYLVLLLSISGILARNWDSSMNAIFTLMVLVATIVLTIVKVLLVAWRHKHRPLFTEHLDTYERTSGNCEVRGLLQTHKS